MERDLSGWGTTNDEGSIIFIDKERTSKNGSFIIFSIRDKITNEIKRFQAWGNAYKSLKNEEFLVGSQVSIPGYVHFYTDEKDGSKQVRVKTQDIFPAGGRLKIRLQITSDWYKGESVKKELHAFSGKPYIGKSEKLSDTLVVRCYMPRTNVLWRKVKKGSLVDVEGYYNIEQTEEGTRIIMNDIFNIEEVKCQDV